MAEAQFLFATREQNISKRFGAPKKQTMEAWFKATRKMIPEIPDPKKTDFIISHEHADLRWITFEMHNPIGEKCKIVIDRTKSFIGGN